MNGGNKMSYWTQIFLLLIVMMLLRTGYIINLRMSKRLGNCIYRVGVVKDGVLLSLQLVVVFSLLIYPLQLNLNFISPGLFYCFAAFTIVTSLINLLLPLEIREKGISSLSGGIRWDQIKEYHIYESKRQLQFSFSNKFPFVNAQMCSRCVLELKVHNKLFNVIHEINSDHLGELKNIFYNRVKEHNEIKHPTQNSRP